MAPTLRDASKRRLPAKLREINSTETQTTGSKRGSSLGMSTTTGSKQGSSLGMSTTTEPPRENPSQLLDPAPSPFVWTPERSVALLFSMIGLKPTGLHKHPNVKLIKERVSKRLGMNVPIEDIWTFLHAHWDLCLADQIENPVDRISKRKCLMEEEGAKLAQEAAQTQESQPSTSSVPSDITK